MGVRIFIGNEVGDEREKQAVLFCSTSDIAFGPIFNSCEEAVLFLTWCDEVKYTDPRELDSIESSVMDFKLDRENGWQTEKEVQKQQEKEI